jgi:ankyrin repeat protein
MPTALMAAAYNGHANIVQSLVINGAIVEETDKVIIIIFLFLYFY